VTGVRVTPISGGLVDRGGGRCGRAVSAGRGSMGCADVSAGGDGAPAEAAAAVHPTARNRCDTHTGHPVTDQRGAEPARLTDTSDHDHRQ